MASRDRKLERIRRAQARHVPAAETKPDSAPIAEEPAPAKDPAPARRDSLFCHFCNRPHQEIKVLIAGQLAYICDECIRLALDLVEKVESEAKRGAK